MLRCYRQLSGTFIVGSLLASVVFAQTAEDVLKSKLTSVHYFLLAEKARIQGDVRLNLNNGLITLIPGHPLLAPTAVESAKAFGSIQSQTRLDLTYHFVIVDTATLVPISTTVKRGNSFERAIMRVFGLKTEKAVQDYRCESGVAPASEMKVNGDAIEIWVFGRTFCLETSTLVASR